MVARGRALGLVVLLADVLPWPAGDERAARDIASLNNLVHDIDAIPLRFHDTLAGVVEGWSDDGDHPSVEGHRLLGAEAARALSELER
jgi:lysophospholipase L1-like esterase